MRTAWLLLGLLFVPANCQAADPSALWNIVNGQCVPHERETRDPAPCSAVDLADGVGKGYAVLKDINGIAQFLLIPTVRTSGIGDPAILAPDAPNYWDAAWRARYFVEERLQTGLPRDELALAINSSAGRTQDQLHIHIDCVRKDVHDALAANMDKVLGVRAPFPVPLAGHTYRAIRIAHETLDGVNPFRILADSGVDDMNMHTLVLVGEVFSDDSAGFILLDDRANLIAGDRGVGEQLEDHTCAAAARAGAAEEP